AGAEVLRRVLPEGEWVPRLCRAARRRRPRTARARERQAPGRALSARSAAGRAAGGLRPDRADLRSVAGSERVGRDPPVARVLSPPRRNRLALARVRRVTSGPAASVPRRTEHPFNSVLSGRKGVLR